MLRIHKAIQANQYPTAVSLAAELEVSAKSIHRDLEFMRDRLRLPVEYCQQKHGYHYTGEVSAFPTVQITEGELFGLLVAEKALQQYRGTSLEQPLLSAIRKLEQSLPATVSLDLAEVDKAISFRTRAEPLLDLQIFETLTTATAAREQLEMDYRKPGQQAPERRVIDPYHLANINGEWFLFAYDHTRHAVRTFAPARIKGLRRTGRHFTPARDFSLEDRLKHSFGVQSGEGRHKVKLRFTARAADYIREKKWHETQEMRELRDGGVELAMTLSGLQEVERWVLSWGGEATPVQPPELVTAVRDAARRLLRS